MFSYKATIFNADTHNIENVCGITAGATFTAAMDSLEQYYGEELRVITSLYPLEDTIELESNAFASVTGESLA